MCWTLAFMLFYGNASSDTAWQGSDTTDTTICMRHQAAERRDSPRGRTGGGPSQGLNHLGSAKVWLQSWDLPRHTLPGGTGCPRGG